MSLNKKQTMKTKMENTTKPSAEAKSSQEPNSQALQEKYQSESKAIKIFGAHAVRGVGHLLSLLCRCGVLLSFSEVSNAFRQGFRGVNFDSRRYCIEFRSRKVASRVQASLTHAQKHHTELKGWRFVATAPQRTNAPSSNRFALLAQQCASVEPEHHIATNVCTWNVNTINKKTRDILEFASERDIGVLGLVETRCKDDLSGEFPGWTWFGRQQTKTAKGVGFLVNASILADSKVDVQNGQTQDTLSLLVSPRGSRSTLFMLVYGKQNADAETSKKQWTGYRRDLRRFLRRSPTDTDVVFLGDINARMGRARTEEEALYLSATAESKRNVAGREALQFLAEFDLVCLNDRDPAHPVPQYTYSTSDHDGTIRRSTIDVICVSRGMYRDGYNAAVLRDELTGAERHSPVVATLRWHRRKSRQRKIPERHQWNVKALEHQHLKERYQEKLQQELQTPLLQQTADQTIKNLQRAFESAAASSIGRIKVGGSARRTRKEKCYAKKKAELREFKQSNRHKLDAGNANCHRQVKEMKANLQSLRKEIAKHKHKHLGRKIERHQIEGDTRSLYRTLRSFNRDQTSNNTEISCVLDNNGYYCSSTADIHRVMRDYWRQYFTNRSFEEEMSNLDVESLAGANHNAVCDADITTEEIKSALKTIKKDKSQGLDGIYPYLLKEAPPHFVPTLRHVFNQILHDGRFPLDWKTDRRTPIHKSGNRAMPDRYRLLAIHSAFRKIFCTILEQRLQGVIELDDAQNGFRRHRRGTDNILVLQSMLKETSRKQRGAHVLVVDFSKAFDTCHIPTMLQKLANRGIGGAVLRVIADMYTNAQARLFINGVLGKSFPVTNGVAQGCALSPLLFAIYLDDLLKEFRKSGLGVPLGALRANALSFADDLLLLSPDAATTRRYIDILQQWCKECHLSVNVAKSGIVRCGALALEPMERFLLNGKPLKYLEEKDPLFDEESELEYLGVTMPRTGSWSRFIDSQLTKANKAYGQFWDFFHDAEVSTSLKVAVAKTTIFSRLTYCQEIAVLSAREEAKIDSFQAKVLRTILRAHARSSSTAIRYLLGQPSLSSVMRVSRILNYIRIQNLPTTTRLREVYDEGIWNNRTDIFGRYKEDMAVMTRAQERSSIPKQVFDETIKSGNSVAAKLVLKKINREAELAQMAHRLRLQHAEILNFSPAISHPLWQLPTTLNGVAAHAKWLVGTISNTLGSEHLCRLCQLELETRDHLLLHCEQTQDLRKDLCRSIAEICPHLWRQFETTPKVHQLAWLLAGGASLGRRRVGAASNRPQPLTSAFLQGTSVSPIHGKKDRGTNTRAYRQYLQIEKNTGSALRIYTDGSAPSGYAGCGVAMYKPKCVVEVSQAVGQATNNVAELEAINLALQKLLSEDSLTKAGDTVHLFTDSQYAQNALLSCDIPKKNFFLIESIRAIGWRLIEEQNIYVQVHWVPSHIENTHDGECPIIGNARADKLAEAAREKSTSQDTRLQTTKKREKLIAIVGRTLHSIQQKLSAQEENPQNGPSNDDFGNDASQDTPSDSCDTSVLYPPT